MLYENKRSALDVETRLQACVFCVFVAFHRLDHTLRWSLLLRGLWRIQNWESRIQKKLRAPLNEQLCVFHLLQSVSTPVYIVTDCALRHERANASVPGLQRQCVRSGWTRAERNGTAAKISKVGISNFSFCLAAANARSNEVHANHSCYQATNLSDVVCSIIINNFA